MLASLFGTSDRLSELLIRHPAMWEPFTGNLGGARIAEELTRPRAARMHALAAPPDEEREGWRCASCVAFKPRRCCASACTTSPGIVAAGRGLRAAGRVAEACVTESIGLVTPPLVARYGQPATGLTVLGLGSLGAREMRYGSDLDLVFLTARKGSHRRA